MNWSARWQARLDWIDGEVAPLCSENGRPGIETRFMIGLPLLEHICGLSDEGICEREVHDQYFRFFTERVLPARLPARALGSEPLAQAARRQTGADVGGEPAGGARGRRVTQPRPQAGDTTVQPKAITFPTDAKPLMRPSRGLNPPGREARRQAVTILLEETIRGRSAGPRRSARSSSVSAAGSFSPSDARRCASAKARPPRLTRLA